MNIKNIKVGYLETNCYILEKDNKCLIIDPGDEIDKIKRNIKYQVVGILITHNHFDHVGALEELKVEYKTKVYDFYNIEKSEMSIEEFYFKIIKNPGHSIDSISFLFNENLFCGDFIFQGTIGRTDFPGGNLLEMQNSLRAILNNYDNLNIYPGHGPSTKLNEERENLKKFL